MKTDTETQFHVSLKHPMSVKMADRREYIGAFDAVIESDASPGFGTPATFWAFKTHTLYRSTPSGSPPPVMRVTLHVPVDNIAGIIAQPFKER